MKGGAKGSDEPRREKDNQTQQHALEYLEQHHVRRHEVDDFAHFSMRFSPMNQAIPLERARHRPQRQEVSQPYSEPFMPR